MVTTMLQTQVAGQGDENGFISWYDFTKEIYKDAGLSTKVTPVTTAEYGLSKANSSIQFTSGQEEA